MIRKKNATNDKRPLIGIYVIGEKLRVLQFILDEVLQALEFKIEESKAIITSDQLPNAVVIVSQFRQLFQNLLSNSLKFAQKRITPNITIGHHFLKEKEVKALPLPKSSGISGLILKTMALVSTKKMR